MLGTGLGFAKQAAHSWEALARLDHPDLLALDLPMLVGASRKSFLQAAVGARPPHERDAASAAAATAAVLAGAHIVRVHDVAETVQALRVLAAISAARYG